MFSWKLFQDNELIEEHNNIKYIDEIFYVNEKLYFDTSKNKLFRYNNECEIIIDISNECMLVNLVDGSYNGSSPLIKSLVNNNEDLEIIYQLDNENPINKIIISRKD